MGIIRRTFSKLYLMMTSSNGNIFRVTVLCEGNSPVIGEFPSQSPVTRSSFMFSLSCALNKRLSKQWCGWWFETPSRSLWRHCNLYILISLAIFLSSFRFMSVRPSVCSVPVSPSMPRSQYNDHEPLTVYNIICHSCLRTQTWKDGICSFITMFRGHGFMFWFICC